MTEFDHSKLDDVVHGRLRLGILAFLSSAGTADFNALKKALKASDGNLSTHLRKLEEAGYVAVEKRFQGRRPQTRVTLTGSGRAAFIAYLSEMESLLALRKAPTDTA